MNLLEKAERRKLQNRLNQRATRRRRALKEASTAKTVQADTTHSVPDEWKIALKILPEPHESQNGYASFADEQRRILSTTLFSASALDQARVLSPLLANPHLREVWWTSTNMLWPALEPPDRQGHRNLPWTWSFTRHGLSDPLLFHALTSASAVAVQMFKGVTKARERLVLQHETQAVQLVRGELSENSGNPRDELLFAMILMMRSTDNVVALAEAKTLGAFRPPLTNLQNLQAGSSLSYRTTHREILCRLVAQKGGIAAIAIPGVAEFFNIMDLFQASLGSQRPDFDLCSSYGHFLDSEVPVLRQKYQAALSVASHFPTAELEESFQLIVCDIRCYLDMIESYGQVRWPHVHHGTLASFRNVIQHRLLSVDSNPSKPLREVCRLAILLFSSVVVYPLQNRKPMLFYLDNMTKLLKSEQHMDENFRLWLLVLGGMAADQAPLQSWYVSKLRSLVSTQPKSWSRVRELLRGFLWLDSACGEGGLELWLRVIQDD